MKTMTKILGIGLIVLIAMVGIGAVSAYEIYDDTNDQPSIYSDDAGVNYRDEINGSFGGITVDDWNVDTRGIDIRAKGIGYDTFDVPVVPREYDIHIYTNGMTGMPHDGNLYFYTEDVWGEYISGGIIYNNVGWGPDSDDPELNWNSETNTGFFGSTFQGNVAPATGGAIYNTNGMTGQLDDGNGNLLSVGESGFVVPGSDLNPPRPDINIPYYPTDVTEI